MVRPWLKCHAELVSVSQQEDTLLKETNFRQKDSNILLRESMTPLRVAILVLREGSLALRATIFSLLARLFPLKESCSSQRAENFILLEAVDKLKGTYRLF